MTSPVLEAGGLRFEPAAAAAQWRLTVSGPGGYYLRREFSGSDLTLSLAGEEGVLPPDGSYLWELQPLAGTPPVAGMTRSGSFRVRAGEILLPDATQIEPVEPNADARSGVPLPQAPNHVGPFYIDGPLAFGKEIDGTESVAFLSMLVEEDNIRLKLVDTSETALFPTNDWQLTLNDSANGGADYFAIEDVTDSNSRPFRIDAGAGDDAIHIDQNGRVGIGLSTPATLLHVDGDTTLDGDLAVLSSRAAKESFMAVDAAAVLARVAELPLLEWSYLGDPGVRHLGPTAEAFHAAFLLGRDERSINPLDLAGVALAAIQSLRSRVVDLGRREEAAVSLLRDQERQIATLEADRDLMRQRIESLERIVRGLAADAGASSASGP